MSLATSRYLTVLAPPPARSDIQHHYGGHSCLPTSRSSTRQTPTLVQSDIRHHYHPQLLPTPTSVLDRIDTHPHSVRHTAPLPSPIPSDPPLYQPINTCNNTCSLAISLVIILNTCNISTHTSLVTSHHLQHLQLFTLNTHLLSTQNLRNSG